MIQNIIVYLIIAATLAYVLFSVFRNLYAKKENASHCGGCDGCSIKNELSDRAGSKRGC
jgi:hypothetical protein